MLSFCDIISRANAANIFRINSIKKIQSNYRGFITREKYSKALNFAHSITNEENNLDWLWLITGVSRFKRYARAYLYIAFSNYLSIHQVMLIYNLMNNVDKGLPDNSYYLGWSIPRFPPVNTNKLQIYKDICFSQVEEYDSINWIYIPTFNKEIVNWVFIPNLVYSFAL